MDAPSSVFAVLLRSLTALEQRQHATLAPARSTAENKKQAIFEHNEEFNVFTSQNPCFFLKDLTKIFFLMRFEKISQYSVIIKNRW